MDRANVLAREKNSTNEEKSHESPAYLLQKHHFQNQYSNHPPSSLLDDSELQGTSCPSLERRFPAPTNYKAQFRPSCATLFDMRGKAVRLILTVFLVPFAAFVIPPWHYTEPDRLPDIFAPYVPSTTTVIAEETSENIGIPLRIIITSIGVDAVVRDVGLTKESAMDLAKDPLDTSWYRLGARPGAIGSAVIAGHVNWYNQEPAVFENLHDISLGDTILVLDDKNEAVTFVVRDLQSFNATANAEEVFTSSDGKSHLNLITCEGVWNAKAGQYTSRFVVFADRKDN